MRKCHLRHGCTLWRPQCFNMCILLCFGTSWFTSYVLHLQWGNCMTATMEMKQPWRIYCKPRWIWQLQDVHNNNASNFTDKYIIYSIDFSGVLYSISLLYDGFTQTFSAIMLCSRSLMANICIKAFMNIPSNESTNILCPIAWWGCCCDRQFLSLEMSITNSGIIKFESIWVFSHFRISSAKWWPFLYASMY